MSFAQKFKNLFFHSHKDIHEMISELEETLLQADVGPVMTDKIMAKITASPRTFTKEQVLEAIKQEFIQLLTPKSPFEVQTRSKPTVIYFVGVNGSGKTTTIGKLARHLISQGLTVLMIAADTFRAAAMDQLKLWSERVGTHFVGGQAGADPASVIVDGLRSAKSRGIDVVLVDTAGRLQTKTNLLNELKKMVRMSEKELGKNPDEIFLVLDAITGQNGLAQAKVFLEAIPVSGIILTKYDATQKGGILLSVVQETGLPVRFIGVGEKIGDLKTFNAHQFVQNLFE